MSNLAKTVKKIHNPKYLKEKLDPTSSKTWANPLNVIESGVEDIGEAFTPEVPVPEEQTIIPIPTASTAQTDSRKRRARGRSSGRSSTILTEGLGG